MGNELKKWMEKDADDYMEDIGEDGSARPSVVRSFKSFPFGLSVSVSAENGK